jgi:serine/threonine-protein kinase RsbW
MNTTELGHLLEDLNTRMYNAGYPSRDLFSVRLAVEEAGVNALKHGHGGRETRPVRIRYRITADQVVVEVKDQGLGFDPGKVPDPLAGDNLERASGRGLFLMQAYTTWLRYNKRGNRVTLCKHRSPDEN